MNDRSVHKVVNIAQIKILAKFLSVRLTPRQTTPEFNEWSASDVAMEEYA
ncbi:MAG: hypothetical protein ACI8XX_002175 [Polaribacter sp.]|jgi:hypothetical protein